MAEIAKNNMLFVGDDDKRVQQHCISELQKQTYFLIGKMLALSVMHGGPPPVFFALSVVDYIFYGTIDVCPSDVPDRQIQEALIEVIFF